MSASIEITDPTRAEHGSLIERIGISMIHDPRDLAVLSLMVTASVVIIPFAILLYVPGVFSWWLGLIYFAANGLLFLDRYILMLHIVSHRPLFKKPYRWLNGYIPRVLAPFFGETPDTYYSHHVGMHHPENNLHADLSSTMRFQRDNAFHFARYFTRFFFFAMIELTIYLWRKGRRRLAVRAFFGEFMALGVYALLLWVNWRATLVVFVIPYLLVRFLMMAGNWGQHAFIHPDRPESPYVNSITCINTRYNRRCFNDGYHIGHHVLPNRHWTDMPGDFQRNIDRYAAEGAIVFDGIDFFQVWAGLMFHRYEWLAKHYVTLDGQSRTVDEIVALLKSRTRPILATA